MKTVQDHRASTMPVNLDYAAWLQATPVALDAKAYPFTQAIVWRTGRRVLDTAAAELCQGIAEAFAVEPKVGRPHGWPLAASIWASQLIFQALLPTKSLHMFNKFAVMGTSSCPSRAVLSLSLVTWILVVCTASFTCCGRSAWHNR
ncbi:hypothetical protein GCM10025858_17590 [Alicyclobacillus sacchari]|uniref:hypothetical protein n=1 Tax=Alicyclobacillus sacchari TaxID=392010 RepID=UPI0023E8FD3F|nr:hypothetical protein [Alicyclobacillus sacchari]GMA57256.1 hypothetical protein GCM10025858_17590 [Alicyclobacillus sacchari]